MLGVTENGVYLIQLAEAINVGEAEWHKAQQTNPDAPDSFYSPPMKLHLNAKTHSGTWQARDNVAQFIQWSRNLGVRDTILYVKRSPAQPAEW